MGQARETGALLGMMQAEKLSKLRTLQTLRKTAAVGESVFAMRALIKVDWVVEYVCNVQRRQVVSNHEHLVTVDGGGKGPIRGKTPRFPLPSLSVSAPNVISCIQALHAGREMP